MVGNESVVAATVAASVAGCRPFRPLQYGGGQLYISIWRNKDAGASSLARLCIILSYYPILSWWCLYSAHIVLVEGVGGVGLTARC